MTNIWYYRVLAGVQLWMLIVSAQAMVERPTPIVIGFNLLCIPALACTVSVLVEHDRSP